MKKILLTGLFIVTLAGTTLVSCSSEDRDTNLQERNITTKSLNQSIDAQAIDPPRSGSVKTVWTLGQKSKLCHGFGLCSHEKTTVTIGKLPPFTFPAPPLPAPKTAWSDVYKIKGEDGIWIEFDDVSAQNIRDFFGGNVVVLDEDFVVEPNVAQVDISEGFTIVQGTYNLQKRSETGLYGILVFNGKR